VRRREALLKAGGISSTTAKYMDTKTFSREELRAFEKELAAYRVTHTGNNGTYPYIDFDQYLVDKRVCVRREGDYRSAICNVPLYDELNDKYDQLRTLIAARTYAKAKELEELDVLQSA
jgi:hypothetical protein